MAAPLRTYGSDVLKTEHVNACMVHIAEEGEV
jgi:hypothetical protein